MWAGEICKKYVNWGEKKLGKKIYKSKLTNNESEQQTVFVFAALHFIILLLFVMEIFLRVKQFDLLYYSVVAVMVVRSCVELTALCVNWETD